MELVVTYLSEIIVFHRDDLQSVAQEVSICS